MSNDETYRDPQATPESWAPQAEPAVTPEAPTASAEPVTEALAAPGSVEGQAVTPEQLADAVRAQAERSEALRGGLDQGSPISPVEAAPETNPASDQGQGASVPGAWPQATAEPQSTDPGQASTWARPADPTTPVPADPTTHVQAGVPGSSTPPPFYPGPPAGQFPQGQFPPPGQFPPGLFASPAQPQAPKKMGALPKVLIGTAAALVLALAAGTVGGVVGYTLGNHRGGSIVSVSPGRAVVNGGSLSDVAEKVQASVVGVKTNSGEGSGVVFDANGYILTNNHVVAGANGTLSVTFSDGKSAPAKLIGTDPTNDLAVLKVDQTDGLQPIVFGDSDAIKTGDPVLAIGNPLGLDGTVTAGILSAKNRTISEGGGQNSPFQRPQPSSRLSGLLQTDAAINPGNSGGALVDSAGRLMGINTAIATSGNGSNGNIGVGFAIPSNKARSVAEQLMKSGKVGHPYIGVQITNSDGAAGAVLAKVEEGSPAAQAGLKKDDLVTSVNGKAVKNSDELVSAVQAGKVGEKLTLTVVRDGKTSTITVTVGEAPN